MSTGNSVKTSRHLVELIAELESFTAKLTTRHIADGVDIVTLRIGADVAAAPPRITLRFSQPAVDVAGTWFSGNGRGREIRPDFAGPLRSRAAREAPALCLFGPDSGNRLTFAASDALNAIEMRAGLNEETGDLHCGISALVEAHPPISQYEISLLIDVRGVPFHQSLGEVSKWWETMPAYLPAPVPETARLPMYSTWYSFHQVLDPDAVVAECKLARELGCEAVIVDDGWQTLDAARGYAFCGDWNPDRIPDMAGFVDRIHQLGMKFLLWYSVPFIGQNSDAFARFKNQFLRMDDRKGAGVLDPRFPDVREFLITLYERQMREWKLDGFKLDFVDSFTADAENAGLDGDGRDCASVNDGADRLLSQIIARLSAINPEVMIEFRQSYTGPLMRKYGNMFRAGDCPADYVTNRVRTIDLRLLCGGSAVHADMIMWHPAESVERAALQLLNVLFSVPQISVRLERISTAHSEMLKFWLGFWRKHRPVLLDGVLTPISPISNYPVIAAHDGATRIVAIYDDVVAPVAGDEPDIFIINATPFARVVLDVHTDLISRTIECYDCLGARVSSPLPQFRKGIVPMEVPPSGLLRISVG